MGWCVSVCLKTNIHWNTMNALILEIAAWLALAHARTLRQVAVPGLALALAHPQVQPRPLPQPVARAVVRKQQWSRRLMAGRGHF